MLVIGDVVGHDTEAAAAMGQLRGMLRGIAYREGPGPAAVLTELDAAIAGPGMGTMATAAIARVEQTPEERAAGPHPAALVQRRPPAAAAAARRRPGRGAGAASGPS